MKKNLLYLLALGLVASLMTGCSDSDSETPAATETPAPTDTPTDVPTAGPTDTPPSDVTAENILPK